MFYPVPALFRLAAVRVEYSQADPAILEYRTVQNAVRADAVIAMTYQPDDVTPELDLRLLRIYDEVVIAQGMVFMKIRFHLPRIKKRPFLKTHLFIKSMCVGSVEGRLQLYPLATRSLAFFLSLDWRGPDALALNFSSAIMVVIYRICPSCRSSAKPRLN
jgi:hypothetical protein